MLLAYFHPFGSKDEPARLCVVADKLDPLSAAIPVEALPHTSGGVYRLGQYESCIVRHEPDGGIYIKPVTPTRLYITPNQVDRPGTTVNRVKIFVKEDGTYESFFAQDQDAEDVWKKWDPLEKVQ